MKTVYKYELQVGFGLQTILMPEGADILGMRTEDSSDWEGYVDPVMYALVDPNEPPSVTRVFRVLGTGETFNEEDLTYVDTYRSLDYVYHVFEQEMS